MYAGTYMDGWWLKNHIVSVTKSIHSKRYNRSSVMRFYLGFYRCHKLNFQMWTVLRNLSDSWSVLGVGLRTIPKLNSKYSLEWLEICPEYYSDVTPFTEAETGSDVIIPKFWFALNFSLSFYWIDDFGFWKPKSLMQ